MSHFSSVVIGNESLAIQCGEILLDSGHQIAAIVTRNPDVRAWATSHGLRLEAPGPDLAERLGDAPFDWLLSIANLDIIPGSLLDLPTRGAVNFHDGPLPAYAGLNAPVWAALAGAAEHGISWHYIEGGVDEGDVIARALFPITETDTALTLNTKCYAAAIDSFPTVMAELAKPEPARERQDLAQRSYFARDDRPEGGARLDFTQPAAELARMIRALDHGDYWNPLSIPKFEAGGKLWLARAAHVATGGSGAAPGAVAAADDDLLSIATGAGDLVITRVTDCDGQPVSPTEVTRVGAILPCPSTQDMADLTAGLAPLAKADPFWRGKLEAIPATDLPLLQSADGSPQPIARPVPLPAGLAPAQARTAFALLAARVAGTGRADLALPVNPPAGKLAAHMAPWVPVTVLQDTSFAAMTEALAAAVTEAHTRGPFAADLIARLPGPDLPPLPALGVSDDPEAGLIGPSALTLALGADSATLLADRARVSEEALDLYAARLAHLLEQIGSNDDPSALSILPDSERQQIMTGWNQTDTSYDAGLCVHQAFEAQVPRTPQAEALAFEGHSLTYAELDAAANRMAHKLVAMGAGPDRIIGLHLPRSAELVIAALAIMKAGGAYLPMDPAYPADRTALYIEDSGAAVI
ncbi:MAG: AMP-binding protein, partial [Pseudomonadota bacterium]